MTAADERGDMKEVRLLADGELVGRFGTFPFQFRWTPKAVRRRQDRHADGRGRGQGRQRREHDALGRRGLRRRGDRGAAARGQARGSRVRRRSAARSRASTAGSSTRRRRTAYEWLADGSPIAGAAGTQHTLGEGELGRLVACRITAVNTAGDADATSDGRYVSAASAGPPGPPGTPGTPGTPGPGPGETLVSPECEKRKAKQIECVVRQVLRSASGARLRATGRITGRKKTLTRTGARSVRLRLNQPRRVRSSQKVVLQVRKGTGRLQRVTLKLNRTRVLALAKPR